MKTFLRILAMLLSVQVAYAEQFSVVTFGAVPDSDQDASGAINRAIAAAATGTGNAVSFPTGRFRLSDKVRIEHAHGLTVRGEPGTTLVMDNGEEIVVMDDCRDLTIRSLAFDRKQFAFTQGEITAVDPAVMTCTVQIDGGYDAPDAPHLAKAGFHPFVHPLSGTYQQDSHISQVESWSRMGDGWQAHLTGHAPRAAWLGKRFFL
ncbi:MAG TPA: glycosyl hydrolase family 28-related protein [Planctomycetota bacterium]|nr:glycosyl hydrolase family 28-related protein [Planctomycetota bacterium]